MSCAWFYVIYSDYYIHQNSFSSDILLAKSACMYEYIDPDRNKRLFLNDHYYFVLRLATMNDKYPFVEFNKIASSFIAIKMIFLPEIYSQKFGARI